MLTCTHAFTLTHAHSQYHTHSQSHSHSLSLTLTLTHFHSHSLSITTNHSHSLYRRGASSVSQAIDNQLCPPFITSQDRSLNDVHRLLLTKNLDALNSTSSSSSAAAASAAPLSSRGGGGGGVAADQLKDQEHKSVNKLVASLELSMDHVRRLNPVAEHFFCLMALLPSGLSVCVCVCLCVFLSLSFSCLFSCPFPNLCYLLF